MTPKTLKKKLGIDEYTLKLWKNTIKSFKIISTFDSQFIKDYADRDINSLKHF